MLYVTERCVFRLTQNGLELIEIAPGVDLERDIMAKMDFKPSIPRKPLLMDKRIFGADPMGLRDDMLSIPLEQRFTYDEATNRFFVNLERFVMRDERDIVEQHLDFHRAAGVDAMIVTDHASVDTARVVARAQRVFDTRNATKEVREGSEKVRRL